VQIYLHVNAIQQKLAGIGRYSYELAKGLLAHSAIDVKLFARGLFDKPLADFMAPSFYTNNKSKVRALPCINTIRHLFLKLEAFKLNRKIKDKSQAIYHAPNFIIHQVKIPTVATIHDFSFIHYPEFHPKDRVAFFRQHLTRTIHQAHHLITDSEFIRQELLRLYAVSPDKVTAVPLGISAAFKSVTGKNIQTTLVKYHLQPKQYCLAVSTLEPRKNFKNLLLAYANLPEDIQIAYPLVLVGSAGWLSEDLHKTIARLQLDKKLQYLGYVDEADLPAIYAGAKAFLYPSIYEGFGLPIIEAMASGTAVLTSNISSMPEVASGAAFLIDPNVVSAITHGLEKILTDEALNSDLMIKGKKVAEKSTWQNCIEKTINVYQALI